MSVSEAHADRPSTPTLMTQAGRERLVNNLALGFAALGTLGFGGLLLTELANERQFLLQALVVLVLFWFVALLRRLPFNVRAGGLLLLTVALVWLTVLVGGIAGGSRQLLIMSTLMAVAFFGRRGGFLGLAVSAVVFAALGVLQSSSVLLPVAAFPAEGSWVVQLLGFSSVLVVAGFILSQIVVNSQDVLRRQQTLTQRLGQEQARQAEQVEERTRALRLAADIGRGLTQILNPEDLIETLVSTVQQDFSYHHVQFYELADDGQTLILRSGTGEEGVRLRQSAYRLKVASGVVGRAATLRTTVLVGNVADSSSFTANPILPETRAELAVPVLAGDALLGVIDVQHDVARALNENDANLLEIVAAQAGVALRNARQFQKAEARAVAAGRRNRLRELIQGTTDVETLLRVAARALGDSLQAEHTALFVDTGLLGDAVRQEQTA